MKRIALLAQNQHEAAAALAIARRLGGEGWGVAELVSLDRFLDQSAASSFEGSGVAVRAVEPRSRLQMPFYRLPALGRLRVVLANQSLLADLAERYDAVIVGCDGALERVLINAMKRRGKPTYLVISSLTFAPPETAVRATLRRLLTRLRLNHLFYSEIGQGMCHRTFAPGEYTRRVLLDLGVPDERVEVTGSPRFAPMMPERDPEREILGRLEKARPVRLLYLMGAWEWHGAAGQARGELEQIGRCAEAAGAWPGRLELAVRPHPRSSPAERRRLASIPGIRALSAERPLRRDLEESDAVLAAISTGLLEAIALGRLVLVVDLAGIGSSRDVRDFAAAGLWVLSEPAALEAAFEQLLSPGEEIARRARDEAAALKHFLAETTPLAAGRIVARIRTDLGVESRSDRVVTRVTGH